MLADSLGLRDYVVVPLVPESRAVALLVVDRADDPVDDDARLRVELFAHLLTLALERTVLRTRLHDVATEVRHLTVSANALMTEATTSPVEAIRDRGWEPLFVGDNEARKVTATRTADRLTPREDDIAGRLARGQSNRDRRGPAPRAGHDQGARRELYREWGYTALTRHREEARFSVNLPLEQETLPGSAPTSRWVTSNAPRTVAHQDAGVRDTTAK